MTPRDQISLRLSRSNAPKIAALIQETDANRSAVINALLAAALADPAIVNIAKQKLADL